jgi:hypothetical protein
VSTGEHGKSAENSAVLSGVFSAVSTGEQSGEHSNPSIAQNQQDLQAPKKSIEVKKEKKEGLDAVRRPFDAERPHSQEPFCSPSEKKKKLTARLAEAARRNGNQFKGDLDADECAAFNAIRYQPKDLKSLTCGFVFTAWNVYDDHKDDGLLPGILCSKVIDRCMSEQEACKTLGSDPSEFFWFKITVTD